MIYLNFDMKLVCIENSQGYQMCVFAKKQHGVLWKV